MDSFVDFDYNSGEQRSPPPRKSPLNFFRSRKKSMPGESRDKQPHHLSNVRSVESFDHTSSGPSQARVLPSVPPPVPPVKQSNHASNGSQGTYGTLSIFVSHSLISLYFIQGPLRTSPKSIPNRSSIEFPEPHISSQPSANYEGLPNPYEQLSFPPRPNYAFPSSTAGNSPAPNSYEQISSPPRRPSYPSPPSTAGNSPGPNAYEQISRRLNYASPPTSAGNVSGPWSGSIPSPPDPPQPESAFDTMIQRDGRKMVDDSRILDQDLAPEILLADSLRKPEHKHSIEVIGSPQFELSNYRVANVFFREDCDAWIYKPEGSVGCFG